MLLNELGGQAFRLIKKRLNQMKRFFIFEYIIFFIVVNESKSLTQPLTQRLSTALHHSLNKGRMP